MEPRPLQELASFSVAKYVWSSYINHFAGNIHLEMYRECPTFKWKNLSEVENFFRKLYPGLPQSLSNSILFAASLIGIRVCSLIFCIQLIFLWKFMPSF